MVGSESQASPDVDVAVVGAGMGGLYLLYRLRELGLSARAFETADDVGGTWYWNRYPGARCDIQSIDYSYSFDPELETEWQWTEKYATQPEILAYLQHVADKHELRPFIQFSTRVESAQWDEAGSWWQLTTSQGEQVTARHYVMATGCLSQPKDIDIAGLDRFGGETYWTSRWPTEGADLAGKRVAVIGTGSSGIQSIPLIAQEAAELTVFQRTPNFSTPAHNGPIPEAKRAAIAGRHTEYREEARWSQAGVPATPALVGALQVSEEERQAAFERIWARGELLAPGEEFNDLLISEEANATYAEFLRTKIRSIVDDQATAEILCPTDHPAGTKRPCLDTNYFQTFNLPHVELVDLRRNPIETITETGIDTAQGSMAFDAIVFATGFDAMTGAIVAVDITGRDGVTLAGKWVDGPKTYLGLTVAGFPNFFTVTGPGSPSVLSNMAVSIEQHVEWISETIAHLRDEGLTTIEALAESEDAWVDYVNESGDLTLFPKTNSWYMGANVPGKPRVFLPFVGGVGAYRRACNEVIDRGYLGFEMGGGDRTITNEGIVRPLKPDVTILLETMAELDLPLMETMSPEEARAFMEVTSAQRPPGPEVGEIVDGTFPGAGGELTYRLYRPPTEGPHPVVAYFHGGGWVLGSHDSDDPFCRDLCLRADAIIVSADYRHAPEARFPAAVDDGFAAVEWIAANAESLGGIPGQLAVCGWSAGGNIAAVACQQARDQGGPEICGQLLVTPVTDCDLARPSYTANGDGYLLTRDLMTWFWDHYAEPADRTDPRASPLRGELSNLPPALVVTSEFDPLRDEGAAYAAALAEAGVEVGHVEAEGQIHTSLTAVDMIMTGAGARVEMMAALRGFFGGTVPA
jgi:cation diffusion facilitator CzcD-associated flavoprotein CzcO/acetyl esterase/lipase